MITKTISLLKNSPNVVNMSQADVDLFALDAVDRQQFIDSVDLFSSRAKSHFTYKYVKFHLDNNFKYIDIDIRFRLIKKRSLFCIFTIENK